MAEEAGSQIGDAFISIGGSRRNLDDALKAATKDVADWVTRSSAALSNIQPRGLGGLGGPGGRGGGGGLPVPGAGGAGGGLGGLGRIGQAITGGAKALGRTGLGRLFAPLTGAVGAIDYIGLKRDVERLGKAMRRPPGDPVENFNRAMTLVNELRDERATFGGAATALPAAESYRALAILGEQGVPPSKDLMKRIIGHAEATGKSMEEVAGIYNQLKEGKGDVRALGLPLPDTALADERLAAFDALGDRQYKMAQERLNNITTIWKSIGIAAKEAIPTTIANLEELWPGHRFSGAGAKIAEAFGADEAIRTGLTQEERARRGIDPAMMLRPDFDPTMVPGPHGPPAPSAEDRRREADTVALEDLRRSRDETLDMLDSAMAPGARDALLDELRSLKDAIAVLSETMENIQGDPVPAAGTPDVETDRNKR